MSFTFSRTLGRISVLKVPFVKPDRQSSGRPSKLSKPYTVLSGTASAILLMVRPENTPNS